jgi:hypothetical protein
MTLDLNLGDFDIFKGNPPILTVDKYARIYINSVARDILNVCLPTFFYVGYSCSDRVIGIAKPGEVNVDMTCRPVRFDKRSYASVSVFLEKYQIDYSESKRYVYIGQLDEFPGWHFFQLENYAYK